MGWETSDVVRFDFGPLLQGQTKIAKLQNPYSPFIIVPRVLDVKLTYGKSWAESLLMWSNLTLGTSFKVRLG